MLKRITAWSPPAHWIRVDTIDAHTAGEPLRTVIGGFPDLPGNDMLARRRHAKENLDDLREALMREPRGHAGMYGCIPTPPVSRGADLGVLFMHNDGYSTMCGHGIIGLATVVLETGLLPVRGPETVLRIDTPAGLVAAHAKVKEGRVESVCFRNVPAFVLALDETGRVPGRGTIRYDLAFGGAFYAYVSADQVGLTCAPEESPALVETGMAIKRAIVESRSIVHPLEEDLGFLYGVIFSAPARTKGADARNVCIFADGQVDRSPTGTGVSGALAIHHARGELGVNEALSIESLIGSRFIGRISDTTTVYDTAAVIPEVEGRAYITGRHEFFLDPDDPLKHGFML